MLRHANTINFQKGHFDEVISEDFKSKSWNVWVIWYNSAIWVSISDKNRCMKDRERNPQLPFALHPKYECEAFLAGIVIFHFYGILYDSILTYKMKRLCHHYLQLKLDEMSWIQNLSSDGHFHDSWWNRCFQVKFEMQHHTRHIPLQR